MKYKIGDKVRVSKTKLGFKKDYEGTIVTIRDFNPNGEKAYDEPHYGVCGSIPFIFLESELVPVNTKKIVITSDGVETLARLYDGNKVIKTATAKCSPDDTFDFETGARIAFDRLNESALTKSLRKLSEALQNIKVPKLEFTVKEKPFKFEVGKQYKYDDCVIEITDARRNDPYSPVYKYKDVKGTTTGMKQFIEKSIFADSLTPYEPPKYYNGKVVCVEKSESYMAYTVGKVYEFKDGRVKIDNGNIIPAAGRKPVSSVDEWNNNPDTYAKFIPFVE
jgi:hypothetical protein